MATRARRDYYAVLGVSRDADAGTIKRAFRALASEWHPDVSDDPSAEERFREIAAAYEVLSRPESRERYDRLGFVGRGIGGFQRPAATGPFDDLLRRAAASPGLGRRGGDVTVGLDVPARDAERGVLRGVRYTALGVCRGCRGAGTRPGGALLACSTCSGSGRVREVVLSPAGRLFQFRLCARCRGMGRVAVDPCVDCRGAGQAEEERTALVRVPAGSRDGDVVRFPGDGHAGGPEGEPGDLVVELRIGPAIDSTLVRRLATTGALVAVALAVATLVLLR